MQNLCSGSIQHVYQSETNEGLGHVVTVVFVSAVEYNTDRMYAVNLYVFYMYE